MPAQPHIVIIGAGSASFGPGTVATLLRSEALRGSHLSLVDLNEESLNLVTQVARRMNAEWGAEMTIRASTERREVLPGADFVVVSIEVPPREVLWRMDWEIPLKHGLRQPYGENGGPGGFMHTCRQIPPLLAIARDMETLCPDAWLINFSNPLPRLTRAISKYTRIKTVGKCHQIKVGYAIVATLLAGRYGITVPPGVRFHSDPGNVSNIGVMAEAGQQHVKIKVAGLNHFIWLLDVRDRRTGEDLYPALRAARADAPPTMEPLSMDLFRIFGYCPVPGDTHLCEYLPWLHDAQARPWERYEIPLYDWGGNENWRDLNLYLLRQMAVGKMSVAAMQEARSEGAVELIEGMWGNLNVYDETVNVPNRGAIANLGAEVVVEVPALINRMGVQPLPVGPLPPAIAELCRREAALVELVVDAAVSGDRKLALQALLLDPMIDDIARAEAILDDYLTQFADYLPQF
ncbi:MAG: alpha-glucosidase/alpha-galactosidase [Anaerolineales bacterium]|nr:alpha-glucosidase/alpha-galactosidase [Anaerolineales bacterium]MCB8953938.1 hypothetical protein [Ardenticatenales bacterium]